MTVTGPRILPTCTSARALGLALALGAFFASQAWSADAPPPAAAAPTPVRLAVLAEDVSPESRALADLLTVELAAIRHVETVERAEIERVLDEQHLTAAAFVDADSRIRLGKVLGAHGLIFIRQDAANSRLLARLVESRKGYIAGFIKQSTVRLSAQLSVRVILKPILDALPKLSIDVAHLQRVTLLQFKNVTFANQSEFQHACTRHDDAGKRSYKWNENDFAILLLERLCRETDIVVMERRQLGELLDESKLIGDDASFSPSSLFIDGELAMVPGKITSSGLTNVVFSVRFLDLAFKEVHRIQQFGSMNSLKTLTLSTVEAIGDAVRKQEHLPAATQIENERTAMLALAQRNGHVWTADAAYALNPTDKSARDLMIDRLLTTAGTQIMPPVSREKLMQVVGLPLARATRICLENNLSLLEFKKQLTSNYMHANLNNRMTHADPELNIMLRPFRTKLRHDMELTPLETRSKAAMLAAWCPIFLNHSDDIIPYRKELFERIISDTTVSDADKDFVKGLFLFQYPWPTHFIERLRVSDDPVMRFYATIANMRAQETEAARQAAARLALSDLEATLCRSDAIGSYLYLKGIDQKGREWMHLALQEIIQNCPELRKPVADSVVHALETLRQQNHWWEILLLNPEKYLAHVEPSMALRWLNAVEADKPSEKSSRLSDYSLRTLMDTLGSFRETLRLENHDHLQIQPDVMRKVLLSNNKKGKKDNVWPIPLADLIRQFKTAETVYPQRLLIEGEVLWIAWGGSVDESGSEPMHPCGLMQVDLRSGKLLSWCAGMLPGDSVAVHRSDGLSQVQVTVSPGTLIPYAILPPIRWKDRIIVAQSGVGILLYPAEVIGHRGLQDVQIINQQKGLINNAVRHVMPLNDKLFIANELLNEACREVLMMWSATDQSVHMLWDGGAALSDWHLPDNLFSPEFAALKADESRNCLDIVRHLQGGGHSYGVWSYYPKSGELVFERRIRRKSDAKELIKPRVTPKVWPSGLDATFDIQNWQEGTLAITGPGTQWRIEYFLPPTASDAAPVEAHADFTDAMKAAARRGAVSRLKNMIGRGADINAANEYGSTALMHAIHANQPETALWLIREGADISQKANNGLTALLVAAKHDQLQLTVVDELLKRGANPNDANEDGTTALMLSAMKGHMEVVQRLLDHGADPSIRNRHGITAADYAAWSPNYQITLHFINDIVSSGRVNQALLRAVCENRTNNAALLLTHGADISKGDIPSMTLLHRAVEYSLPTTVQFLIDRGAKLDSQNSFGRTPLQEAAVHDRWDNVRVLLRAGANPLVKSEVGETLYDFLHLHDKWDILLSLESDEP